MFIPTTKEELNTLNWKTLDIIISGDTYIDSPYNGAAVVGKVLINNGFNVEIIIGRLLCKIISVNYFKSMIIR